MSQHRVAADALPTLEYNRMYVRVATLPEEEDREGGAWD